MDSHEYKVCPNCAEVAVGVFTGRCKRCGFVRARPYSSYSNRSQVSSVVSEPEVDADSFDKVRAKLVNLIDDVGTLSMAKRRLKRADCALKVLNNIEVDAPATAMRDTVIAVLEDQLSDEEWREVFHRSVKLLEHHVAEGKRKIRIAAQKLLENSW